VRNGPALFELRTQRLRHWFDGQAMLHAFAMRDGQVRYTNRFVRGRAYRANVRAGRLRYREFATDPCHALFARVKALFAPDRPGGVTDNAAIHVARIGAHHAALTEGALPVAFDPATLRTLGVVDWNGRAHAGAEVATASRVAARDPGLVTAHPHATPAGTLVNLRVRFGRRCAYELFAVEPDQAGGHRARTLATLVTDEPAYVHSFGLTASTAIVVESPWTVRPSELLRDGLAGRSFAESYRWRTGRPTRFRLLDLAGLRAPVACEAPPLFSFHHVNAFDDGDAVVCDLVAYPDATVVDALYLDRLRDASHVLPVGRVQRWRLPRAGGRATCVAEHEARDRAATRRAGVRGVAYRYAYGCGAGVDGHFLDRVVKLDMHTGTAHHWTAPRCYPGEPVFVPRPAGATRTTAWCSPWCSTRRVGAACSWCSTRRRSSRWRGPRRRMRYRQASTASSGATGSAPPDRRRTTVLRRRRMTRASAAPSRIPRAAPRSVAAATPPPDRPALPLVTPPVLIVPGWTNSGPEHWQSHWERAHPEWRRVEQADWIGRIRPPGSPRSIARSPRRTARRGAPRCSSATASARSSSPCGPPRGPPSRSAVRSSWHRRTSSAPTRRPR
jgi:carotenoid cleavage dioxygenase-like enzyme